MRPVVYFLILVAVLLMVANVTGCASAPPRTVRVPTCLTHPQDHSLFCDGKETPWVPGQKYVCHKLEDHESYMAGCR